MPSVDGDKFRGVGQGRGGLHFGPYNRAMSWAMRRRILYATGVFIFFLIVLGGPSAYYFFSIPPSCSDGQQNQGETAPDMGGPCPLADVNTLAPSSVMWARSFKVRDGSYSAASYIENPNDRAGISNINYIFSLYDAQNILIAERRGTTFVMPGGITPVYEPDIDTGQRIAVHAFFQFTSAAVWRQYSDTAKAITVTDRKISDETTVPRIEATATNTDVSPRTNVTFVAVIFDTAGNAFASSATHIDRMEVGQAQQIVFTWPSPFTLEVGRIDIIPTSAPKPAWTAKL
jgi:hypothetical protein